MLGVVVLVVAILALRNPHRASTSPGTDTRTVTITAGPSGSALGAPGGGASSGAGASAPPSVAGAGAFPLVVLNDDGANRQHLARRAARLFESAGWTVSSYDENYSNDILSTVAYYDPTVPGSKRAALALQQQFPSIKRVVPRFPELPAAPIVVVLTSDYTPS